MDKTAQARPRILVCDDENDVLAAARLLFKGEGVDIQTVSNTCSAIEAIKSEEFDLVLLDLNYSRDTTSGKEGFELIERIREDNPKLPIVVMTAWATVDIAVQAMRIGANDFITKPWDPEKLIVTLKNTYRLRKSGQEVKKLKNHQQQLSADLARNYQMYQGSSLAMRELMDTLDRVARTDASVLILGENGTGKELIARELHRRSKRAEQIFVGVDLASITESLFESEMFGHVKGAFTDAKEDRTGRFENANEGTLFLDEIGNVPLSIQAKLLQVIQNRELIRVGDNRPVSIDIRLITATNKPLKKMISEGSFREDLFYRLNTVAIEVPPLRERKEDIIQLSNYFLEQYSRKYDKPGLFINGKAQERLQEYPWPGNVRELKHTMERAVILGKNTALGPEDLHLFDSSERVEFDSFRLDDVEKRTILRVMEKCRGNHSRAAQMLHISRTTLYAKLKKYEI